MLSVTSRWSLTVELSHLGGCRGENSRYFTLYCMDHFWLPPQRTIINNLEALSINLGAEALPEQDKVFGADSTQKLGINFPSPIILIFMVGILGKVSTFVFSRGAIGSVPGQGGRLEAHL